jgi:hypothetical protein
MILWDSFETKFENPTQPASNGGSIATKWNRLESLPTFMLPSLRHGARGHLINQIAQRVGSRRGASNPWELLGSLPRRGHPEIFRDFFLRNFSGPRGGIESLRVLGPVTAWGLSGRFFFADQQFRPAFWNVVCVRQSRRSNEASPFKDLQRALAIRGPRDRAFTSNIFSHVRAAAPGASQSSAGSHGRPRGSVAQIFANFRKLFLASEAQKMPRNSGWGGWVGAT